MKNIKKLRPIEEALDLGEHIAETIEGAREEAARSFDRAASAVRSTVTRGTDAIDDLADRTASRLDSTAKYVRNYHPMETLQSAVRQNPAITMCVGIAVGLFAGHLLRRSLR